jgi:hypothetical protein
MKNIRQLTEKDTDKTILRASADGERSPHRLGSCPHEPKQRNGTIYGSWRHEPWQSLRQKQKNIHSNIQTFNHSNIHQFKHSSIQ